MNKQGLELELDLSREFHRKGIPMLLSPLVLRSWGVGQIDLSRLEQGKVHLREVKCHFGLSYHQARRIELTSELLGELFQSQVELSFALGKKHFLQIE